jgi:hypothetical protein
MAWEIRAKRQYYYRKVRKGKRVISKYCGAGYPAILTARTDDLIRAQQARMQTEQNRAHSDFMDISRQVDQVSDQLRSLINAVLLSSGGYYLHKGQWRRRRE